MDDRALWLRFLNYSVTVRVINGLLFYIGWFLLIVGAAEGWALWAVGAMIPLLALHLAITRDWKKELLLMVAIALAGAVIDSLYIRFGVVAYASPGAVGWMAPLWIVTMYALFATSIDHSIGWMGRWPWAAAVLGGVGGAFSYAVGVRMGAAEFLLAGGRSWVVIGMVWAMGMPLCFRLSAWLDRVLERSSQD